MVNILLKKVSKKVYFCIIFLLVFGCAKKQKPEVIIQIGSEKITLEDIANRIRNAPLSYQEYLATEPGKKQFVDILVRQRIMVTLAKQKGMHKHKEIRAAIKEFKDDYKSKLKQFEEELLVEYYLKELENTELRVTDTEINNYYQKHIKDFTNPTEVQLSHILLSTEAEALEAIKRLQAGAEFEDLAKEISLDPATNLQGGNLGSFKSTELLKEFVDEVKKLKVGEITKKPVRTNYGYHILKKTGQKTLPRQKLDDAKLEIRRLLLKDKFDKWIEKQKQQLNVKVDYSAFRSITK